MEADRHRVECTAVNVLCPDADEMPSSWANTRSSRAA